MICYKFSYDDIERILDPVAYNSQFKYMVKALWTNEWFEDSNGNMYRDDYEIKCEVFKTEEEARAYFDKVVSNEKYPVGPEHPFGADLLKVEYDPDNDRYDELDIIETK